MSSLLSSDDDQPEHHQQLDRLCPPTIYPMNISSTSLSSSPSSDSPSFSLRTLSPPKLPWVLQLMYGLNSSTMSLMTLPLQYVINTRARIPLPFLPTYGAIAFLPWSLKPMYAVLTTLITKPSSSSSQPHLRSTRIERSSFCLGLLALNSLCTASYVLIPSVPSSSSSILSSTGSDVTKEIEVPPVLSIAWVFIISLLWGITNSWSEFCLELSLIDHARVHSTAQTQAVQESVRPISEPLAADSQRHHRHQQQYQPISQFQSIDERNDNQQAIQQHQQHEEEQDSAVARLQSQAAFARNIGSLLATIFTFILFVERYIFHRQDEQLSGTLVNGIFIGTSMMLLFGVGVASFYQHSLSPSSSILQVTDTTRRTSTDQSIYRDNDSAAVSMRAQRNNYTGELNHSDIDGKCMVSNGKTVDGVPVETTDHETLPAPLTGDHFDERTFLKDDGDDDGSHPSYSSLDDDPHLSDDDARSLSSSNSDSPQTGDSIEMSPRLSSNANISLIVLLQIIVVVIAMKEPLSEATSHFAWKVLLVSLVLGLAMTSILLCFYREWNSSHRVGLFLILRNAIPSDSILVSSFYYTIFQSQPLLLQILSIMGTGSLTLSSWLYKRYLSQYSSGRKFFFVLGGTAVFSSLSSLLNIPLYKTFVASNPLWKVFLVGLVARFFGSFSMELSFLPQVVLATKSLGLVPKNVRTTTANTATTNDMPDPEDPSPQSHSVSVGATAEAAENQATIAVKYGSFISCIDFGDQLGSMAGAPLVALLGISRENDFLHLDRLIMMCVILNILVSVGLLPLIPSRK